MSGIAGIFHVDERPTDSGDVERMLDAMPHRGPDGREVWTQGPIGLGHLMLRTTPESHQEKLPFVNPARDLAITADARIDNRHELISNLNFNGRAHDTITDSEIILAAYEKWGDGSPARLLGDFAFALWDGRKRKLFCARDPFGIKPLFYHFNGSAFRWASEPLAVMADPSIAREPNLHLLGLYLLGRYDEREQTLYKGVYRVPCSHTLTVEPQGLRKDEYWDVDPDYAVRYRDDKEYADHFRALFEETVRARLRRIGKAGICLSGGLDSSSILCMAQEANGACDASDELQAFSIVFKGFLCDEQPYIEEVLRNRDLTAHFFSFEDDLSRIDYRQISSDADVAYFPNLLIWAPVLSHARGTGIRVMLDGVGGDEILAAGYAHLTDLFSQGKLANLIAHLRNAPSFSSQSPWALFWLFCVKAAIPRSIKRPLRRLLPRHQRSEIPFWFNKNAIGPLELIAALGDGQGPRHFPTQAKAQFYRAIRSGWNRNIAAEAEERFSAFFGIESRQPFFDRRLVEFCFGLPQEQCWSAEWPKEVLRGAMKGLLPEAIRARRGKAEFSCVTEHVFRHREAHYWRERLKTSTLAQLGLVHRDRVSEMFEEFLRARLARTEAFGTLQVIFWLESWLDSLRRVKARRGDYGASGLARNGRTGVALRS